MARLFGVLAGLLHPPTSRHPTRLTSPFQSPTWFRALSLEERAAAGGHDSSELQWDEPRAVRRLERYRQETGLLSESLYRERLSQLGLEASTFRALFGETDTSLARRCPRPEWLGRLESIYRPRLSEAETTRSNWTDVLRSSPLPGLQATDLPDRDFLAPLLPLLQDSARRLEEGLRGLKDFGVDSGIGAGFDPTELFGCLFRPMPRYLLWMTGRCAVLELHAAALGGELQAESSESRYEEFLLRLGSAAGAIAFLESFPVLARAAVERTESWLRFSLDLVQHLAEDHGAITHAFFKDVEPGPPAEIEAGLSDRHDHGRTVARITFASGERLIYKPRPLNLERAFVEVAQEAGVPANVPKSIDCGDHAYMRFVTPKPCADPAAVERFYVQQGRHLALLYALEATDLHYENVVADGETPQLVDLETLFQPLPKEADGGSTEPVANPTAHTVLRNDFLPRRIWPDSNSPGLDLSGLGAGAGQRTPMTRLVDAGTDRARYEPAWTQIPAGANRPTLYGEVPPLWHFEKEIDRGFREAYGKLLEHRDALVAEDGLLHGLKDLEIRSLLRGTAVYTRLLHTAFHPDLLRDALDRDRLFDKLWLEASQRPSLRHAIPAEREALLRGDVPRFTALAGSRRVCDGTSSADDTLGLRNVGRFFQSSGLDRARQRLQLMGPGDLERQSRLVRESIRAGRPRASTLPPVTKHDLQITGPAPRQELVAEAFRLARHLESMAIECHGSDEPPDLRPGGRSNDLAWFHITLAGPGAWGLEPVGPDLYSGLPGIALFFAHAGALAPKPESSERWRELALQTLDTARRRIAHNPLALTKVGAFAGWGGWIYTLNHLGRLWKDPSLIAEAEASVESLGHRLAQDRDFDLTGGAAGAILAVLSLPTPHPASRLDVLRACGEHLLRHAVEVPGTQAVEVPGTTVASTVEVPGTTEAGTVEVPGTAETSTLEPMLGWPPPQGGGEIPLTGLAHGSTGIAWALTRLANVTGESRYLRAAEQTLAYERSTFDPKTSLWRDVRLDRLQGESKAEAPQFFAWCHGAPGIALGRLGLLEDAQLALSAGRGRLRSDLLESDLLKSDSQSVLQSELNSALEATESQGFGGGHCLCHGDWGHVDLLLEAARRLNKPELAERAAVWAHRLLQQGRSVGWRSGISFDTELPGLMTGLAGIGLGLLRAAYPDRVPSVLALDLPPD